MAQSSPIEADRKRGGSVRWERQAPAWLDGWRSELAGLQWLLVGVVASLDVLEKRESSRGNRILGEARAQVDLIHRDIEYDLTVDTARLSPEECARAILAALPS